jgi:hypothetical protein
MYKKGMDKERDVRFEEGNVDIKYYLTLLP